MITQMITMVDESIDKIFRNSILKAKEKAQEQDGEELKVRDKVYKKYGKIFHPDNLDNLTKEDFLSFFYLKNNKHWTNNRPAGRWERHGKLKDVKNGLKILLDESRPLAERIRQIVDDQKMMKYIGPAIYTSILFIVYPKKYPAINGTVADALDNLGKYSKKDYNSKPQSESIPAMQEIVKQYATDNNFDFWVMDWVWWYMLDRVRLKTSNVVNKWWVIRAGESDDTTTWEKWITNKKFGVGFISADLSRFCKNKKYDKKTDGAAVSKLLKDKGISSGETEIDEETGERKRTGGPRGNFRSQLQWFMESQIKEGVIVLGSDMTIVGLGKITGGYEWDEKHELDGWTNHTKNVDWFDTTKYKIPKEVYHGEGKQPFTSTFGPLPKGWIPWFEKNVLGTGGNDGLGGREITTQEQGKLNEIQELLESKHQIVLYGPPGTGKTYFAKKLALHILGKDPNAEIKDQFQSLKEEEKVNLIQFHPSYSYEDFVQGIKPKTDENGQITYVIQDGIFKKMCESLAETEVTRSDDSLFAKVEQYFEIKSPFVDKQIGIEIGGESGINKIDNEKFSKIFFKTQEQGQKIKLMLEKSMANDNSKFPKSESYFILREGKNYEDKTGKEYHFRSGIPGSKQLPAALADGKRVPFVYYDRNRGGFFGIGVLKGLGVKKRHLGESPKKVLIIDEINRGNLPKIFGELIYALEYRDESIDLQYKEFDEKANGTIIIPKNLLIIATMNTADRSIVLFDTAMRRRFAFVPMMPNYDYILERLGISSKDWQTEAMNKLTASSEEGDMDILRSLLAVEKINSHIVKDKKLRLGRERQIGQSYLINFMEGDISFNHLWKFEIIPLLEEYYTTRIIELTELLDEKLIDQEHGIKDFDDDTLRGVLDRVVGT